MHQRQASDGHFQQRGELKPEVRHGDAGQQLGDAHKHVQHGVGGKQVEGVPDFGCLHSSSDAPPMMDRQAWNPASPEVDQQMSLSSSVPVGIGDMEAWLDTNVSSICLISQMDGHAKAVSHHLILKRFAVDLDSCR